MSNWRPVFPSFICNFLHGFALYKLAIFVVLHRSWFGWAILRAACLNV
jgi:hypothetical protein